MLITHAQELCDFWNPNNTNFLVVSPYNMYAVLNNAFYFSDFVICDQHAYITCIALLSTAPTFVKILNFSHATHHLIPREIFS